MSTEFSGSQVCLRHLALVAYLCSNTYPRFTTLSYKDMHTTVHTELYSNCIFNSTHHQGLKEQVCQKISPSHSVIFNSDEKKLCRLQSLKSSPLSDLPTSGILVQKTSRIRSHHRHLAGMSQNVTPPRNIKTKCKNL